MKVLRRLLLALAIIFILLGLLLPGGLLCIGANDGEWDVLSRTGKPSTPDLITWSEWKLNDRDLVYAFQAYQADEQKPHFDWYRVGIGESSPYTFTFYEGRSATQPEAGHFPALGPIGGQPTTTICRCSPSSAASHSSPSAGSFGIKMPHQMQSTRRGLGYRNQTQHHHTTGHPVASAPRTCGPFSSQRPFPPWRSASRMLPHFRRAFHFIKPPALHRIGSFAIVATLRSLNAFFSLHTPPNDTSENSRPTPFRRS